MDHATAMTVFWSIAGIGIVLLLVVTLVGDFLDGAFDAIDFTGGYLSSTSVLAFLAAFGLVGGWVLGASGASVTVAALAGLGAGLLAGAGAGAAAKYLHDGATTHQITADDYLGQTATVVTDIPAGGLGQVSVTVAGHSQTLAARADAPLVAGTLVTVAANLTAGTVKVVPQGD